jgi:hypothetical protein
MRGLRGAAGVLVACICSHRALAFAPATGGALLCKRNDICASRSALHQPLNRGIGALSMNLKMPKEDPPDPDRYKAAVRNSIASVGAAAAFGAGVGFFKGQEASLEWAAG